MSFAKFQEDVEGMLNELSQLDEADSYLQDLTRRMHATDNESRQIAAEHISSLQLQFVTPWADVPIPLPFPTDKEELVRLFAVAEERIKNTQLELIQLIEAAVKKKYAECSSSPTLSVSNVPQPPPQPQPLKTVPIDES